MNDLREQLAARFANIFFPRVTDALPYAGLANFQKQAWRELADECIRQMEWVRSECDSQVGGAAEDTDERIHNLKLTPAPEDWKP